MNIYDELKERGLVYQVSDEEAFKKLLNAKKGSFYIGFDPTAVSLHVGNLLGIIFAKRLEKAGLTPIMLVGGATGLIGDPSGKSEERKFNTEKDVERMALAIKNQLSKFFNFKSKEALFVNNKDWFKKFSYIGFLRDVGKNFNVAEMLGKDSVKNRLSNGISYTEFSYMLMQGYDFVYLNEKYGATLQVGGSDQWGNITAGLELIRKMKQKEALAATIPLVTDANGKKLGKSEGNAIWLDGNLLSSYHFYQFWLNTDDRDVIKFLKYFTFLSLDEIKGLEKSLEKEAEKREAQRALARAVTEFVHGKAEVEKAEKLSEKIFYGNVANLSEKEFDALFLGNAAVQKIAKKEIESKNIVDFISELNWSSPLSKRQAREDILNGAIELNGKKISDTDYKITKKDILFGKYQIIKRGKKNYQFIEVK